MWVLKAPVGKAQWRVISIVLCNKYNVVLACEVGNKIMLILNPKTGSLIQKIPLPEETGVVYVTAAGLRTGIPGIPSLRPERDRP